MSLVFCSIIVFIWLQWKGANKNNKVKRWVLPRKTFHCTAPPMPYWASTTDYILLQSTMQYPNKFEIFLLQFANKTKLGNFDFIILIDFFKIYYLLAFSNLFKNFDLYVADNFSNIFPNTKSVVTIVIVPFLLPTLFSKKGIFTRSPLLWVFSNPSHFFVIMYFAFELYCQFVHSTLIQNKPHICW